MVGKIDIYTAIISQTLDCLNKLLWINLQIAFSQLILDFN